MKRSITLFAMTALSLNAPAVAGVLEEQFFAMDTSRDGEISRSEFIFYQVREGATERQANFAFDNTAGNDNRISLNEFRAGPAARVSRRNARSNAQEDPRRSSRRSPPRSRGGVTGGSGVGS